MTEGSHSGKSSRQKQSYSEDLSRIANDPTVEMAIPQPSPMASNVSLASEGEVGRKPTVRRRVKKRGLSAHLGRHLPTYIVGLVSAALVLYVALGLPSYVKIERISNQIENQKEINSRIQEDIVAIKDEIQTTRTEIQSQFQELELKFQEQMLSLQYLEKLLAGSSR